MDNQTTNVSMQPSTNLDTIQGNYSKQRKTKSIIVISLLVLMLVAIGALGYLYYATNKTLDKKAQELSAAYQEVERHKAIAEKHEAVATFIAEQNDDALSRQLCGGTPVGMFDVHINDKFAVFRYLCSELTSAAPIRIAALKKLQSGLYEFTYGSSDDTPNNLPSYIYDSEPDFFGSVYGTTRF